ncbi:hypothetical protein Syun_018752 [Stephania yunnanensis]|uniref:Uncharacterized protein n=1 Tax=Stephania yunnanensis TaxID=152371 RepID=A0AAP0NXB0_9MAGN
MEFRSLEGQEMYTGDKIVPLKDLNNFDSDPEDKGSGIALDLVKLFGGKSSVIRKRKEWDLYEPIVDLLSNEEVETLDAREERNARNMPKSQTESETEIRIPSLIPFLIRDGIRDGIRNGHFPNGIYSVSNPFLIRDGIKFPFLIELATTISEMEFIPFLFRF